MSLVPELARVVEERYQKEESRLRDELRARRAHARIMRKIRAGKPDWAEIEKLVVDELPLPRRLKAEMVHGRAADG